MRQGMTMLLNKISTLGDISVIFLQANLINFVISFIRRHSPGSVIKVIKFVLQKVVFILVCLCNKNACSFIA